MPTPSNGLRGSAPTALGWKAIMSGQSPRARIRRCMQEPPWHADVEKPPRGDRMRIDSLRAMRLGPSRRMQAALTRGCTLRSFYLGTWECSACDRRRAAASPEYWLLRARGFGRIVNYRTLKGAAC